MLRLPDSVTVKFFADTLHEDGLYLNSKCTFENVAVVHFNIHALKVSSPSYVGNIFVVYTKHAQP